MASRERSLGCETGLEKLAEIEPKILSVTELLRIEVFPFDLWPARFIHLSETPGIPRPFHMGVSTPLGHLVPIGSDSAVLQACITLMHDDSSMAR